MKNNILGGLVIFMVVLTCLLMIDDITSNQTEKSKTDVTEIEKLEKKSDLASVDNEE